MNFLRTYPKKLIWTLYYMGLGLSLILDVVWLRSDVLHYHFQFQYFIEFFAIFGLFGCMLLILIAKGMGHYIVRDEDYYDQESRR
jgi:hypothetical protein